MDYEKYMQKEKTSLQAFNIMTAYFFIAMLTGSALAMDWIVRLGSSKYYKMQLIPDAYYWWVAGIFGFFTFATIIGNYCLNASIDSKSS